MLKFISGGAVGGGLVKAYYYYQSISAPTIVEIPKAETIPLHVVMNESATNPSYSMELAIPRKSSYLNIIGFVLGENIVVWLLWTAGKILFSNKNENREMEESQQDETTLRINSETDETESRIIKNLYYLGSNCNHSKLDAKIQKILKTSQLEKKVKMRQIAFEPTRSLKKPTSEHANGADIILIPSGGDTHFMDIPYIAILGFGEYEISNKAMEILKQSMQK